MLIYIIRHGETYGNINGDGFSETDLTPRGEAQARLLGERFKNEKIDCIYTSPLTRALKTTAEIKKYHKDVPVKVNSIFLEKGTPADYSGLSPEKIYELLPEAQVEKLFPLGEENSEKAYERAKEIIEKIKAENDFSSTVVIVAHGTFNSFLVLGALGFENKENFNFSHLNTGVTLVNYLYEDGVLKTKLKFLNDTSHLTKELRNQ